MTARYPRKDATVTTTVNEPAERLREWMLNGDGRMWVPDLDAALAAERAIGAEALVGCYHGQPHRCSRCGFEWPAARLTRERNGL